MQQDLIGKRLGNYQIEQPLGRGGMALVYRAMDMTLKRPVAIKVMAPTLTEDRYQERFEHEAQSIAALDHGHIVPVYYFGKSKALYYLAMKLIEGETLETLMSRYAKQGEFLPTSDILHIIEGVASALDYAHSKGVIHRDVKPSNIMLDSSGHAYLTDFGLALNVNRGSVGETFGTAHYISPEQATSSSSAVPQSDLYSLGVVLYELFTGVVPFDDPSPMAIALHHITQPPPSPRALNPQLAPAIEQVILKALEKEPEARYQTGAKLVSALRTALRNTKRDATSAAALPPLPAGMKAPTPRQVSNRPVASEVKTLLEQRAQPKPVESKKRAVPPVALPTDEQPTILPPVARPRRKLRPILLCLLILAIGGGGLLIAQPSLISDLIAALPAQATDGLSEPNSLLQPSSEPATPQQAIENTTSAPNTGLNVRFLYDDHSFWWVNDTQRQILAERIRFARPDESATFWGGRWGAIYARLEAKSCVRLTDRDDDIRMPRPEGCVHTNADITTNRGELFWTGEGEFYVYWDDQQVATCTIGAGECTASLPAQ